MEKDPTSARPPLLLASASPRRRGYLEACGLPFVVAPAAIDERPLAGEAPDRYAARVAEEKARAAHARDGSGWVLACDTVVTMEGRIFGKPADPGEAHAMLTALAGRTHEVLTAWRLQGPGERALSGIAATRVRLRPIGSAELLTYVQSGDPLDKAGGYGIQGGAGRFVADLDGSFANVVGFPIEALWDPLWSLGGRPPAGPIERAWRLVRARAEGAALACGGGAVAILAVTKTQPDSAVGAAHAAGACDLAENHVQALVARAQAFPTARWHHIGPLQRNKVGALVRLGDTLGTVQGLDDLATAQALAARAAAEGRCVRALVQVRLGGEPTKAGVEPAALRACLEALAMLPGLRIEGLMSVPPPGPWGAARGWFATLRQLRDALAGPEQPLATLSMGMTADFEAAIAEGATMVRVGSALFGARS
jgi:septum formation protein